LVVQDCSACVAGQSHEPNGHAEVRCMLADEGYWRARNAEEMQEELGIDAMNPPKGYMSSLAFSELNPKFYK
jgi:hypothetical protein